MRFAVIGSNFITDKFLEAGKACPAFELEAVYSRTQQRAEEFAAQYGARQTFTSLDALAACKEIEAVYIASPNACHKQQAIQLLQSGKHVLCEKPIATNLRDFEEMLLVAKQHNRLLLEAMRPVFMPSFKAIQQHLPQLGTIRRVNFSFCQYSSRYDKFKNGIIENAFRPELSNGALMDIGVYCVHLLVALFGKPEKLTCNTIKLHNGVDAQGSIVAIYPEMIAELSYSKICNGYANSEIQGEEGSLLLSSVSRQNQLILVKNQGEGQDVSAPMHNNDMIYELEAFIEMAQNGLDASLYHGYSKDCLAVMDEARKQLGIHYPAD